MRLTCKLIHCTKWLSLLFLMPALAGASVKFRVLEIDTGFTVEARPLVARLDDSGDHYLVLAGRDEQLSEQIHIYRIADEAYASPELVAALSPDDTFIAYDVGSLDGQDALMFIQPGQILRYDHSSTEFTHLFDVASFYRQERNGRIVRLNFFRDINEDKRDDLVIRDFDGFRIRLQKNDGTLGEESVLEGSVAMDLNGGNVRFNARSLFSGDMNFDGLTDVGYWSGDTIGFYRQTPELRFHSTPDTRESGLGVLSEAEMRMLEDRIGAMDQEGLTERDIESITELNGDGIPDIIVEAAYADGMFDRSNEFSLHLGRQDGEQVRFSVEEDALIAFEGLQFDLIETDINGDGKQDLIVRKAKLSFGRIIRALISGSVPIEIHFHKMTDDDTYADDANFVAKTKVRFSRSSGQVDIPATVVDDFDGDGLQDLMVQTDRDRLSYYQGESTEKLFAKKPKKFEVTLPRNGELVHAEDINDDGRADLVLRFNESDEEGMASMVRLMLSIPAD